MIIISTNKSLLYYIILPQIHVMVGHHVLLHIEKKTAIQEKKDNLGLIHYILKQSAPLEYPETEVFLKNIFSINICELFLFYHYDLFYYKKTYN